jgi:hypothetical protein
LLSKEPKKVSACLDCTPSPIAATVDFLLTDLHKFCFVFKLDNIDATRSGLSLTFTHPFPVQSWECLKLPGPKINNFFSPAKTLTWVLITHLV